MKMATISTHVLNTTRGAPAEGVRVILAGLSDGSRREGRTDSAGRLRFDQAVAAGRYTLRFELSDHFGAAAHMFQAVEFEIDLAEERHYHVPLLVSPFGVTSYRGS